ncbi:hypothetical protein OROMI_013740 [Orobanche minor]
MSESHELPDCIYEKNQPIFICPKSPTPKKTLYLSNLDDQKFLRFSIKYIYVFRKSVNAETLKESLSRVLVEYYPLAGRLKKCVQNDDRKLEIDCNGEGAVFAEAKMDLRAEEFVEFFAAKPNRSLRKLLYRVEAPGFLDIPPLVVQATNLLCGGMILCTAINHCFCDGIGTSQFLHAWAHICRSTDYNNPINLTPPPFHDRHVLQPRSPPRVTLPHPGFTKTTIAPSESNFQTGPNIFEYLQSQPLVPVSITFSPTHILQLKGQCAPSLKCTTFEVLASHTWRCWVKSLGLPPSTPVKLLFSLSIRSKPSLDIPRGYYGNAFVMACAEVVVMELVALGDGVRLVQHAKSTITGECVRSVIDLMEDKTRSMDLSTTLVISQWCRLGLEELDFGEGKPMHMGPLTSDVYCLFLPVVGDVDAVRVVVSMPESVVDRFESYMTEFCGGVGNGDEMNQYT